MLRVLCIALCLWVAPLSAQEDDAQEDDAQEDDAQEDHAQEEPGSIERGADLLSEGARLLLRGLLDEVEPAMRDMARLLEDWSITGLSIDDLGNYHPPEVLPNGDIIIRRKSPVVPEGEGPEIDL